MYIKTVLRNGVPIYINLDQVACVIPTAQETELRVILRYKTEYIIKMTMAEFDEIYGKHNIGKGI